MKTLYVLGAGGMARECLDVLAAGGRADQVAGFVEENTKRRGESCDGIPILDARELPEKLGGLRFIGAIGAVSRSRLLESILSAGGQLESVIDPRATVSPRATLGPGVIILAGAVISTGVTLGRNVIVNFHASLSHDATIGEFSTVCPGVRVGGYSRIGAKCWLGIGAVIKDRTTVGSRSFVGAGACVVKEIPENVLAYGVPARPVRPIDIDNQTL